MSDNNDSQDSGEDLNKERFRGTESTEQFDLSEALGRVQENREDDDNE